MSQILANPAGPLRITAVTVEIIRIIATHMGV